MYKREAVKVKCYQVVGYFQAKSWAPVVFLSQGTQLFISRTNYFDLSEGFFTIKFEKGRSKKKFL